MIDARNLEAEQQLVGTVLIEPSSYPLADGLSSALFADPVCRAAWGVLESLAAAGQRWDVATFVGELKRQGAWGLTGWPATIATLTADAGLASSVAQHAAEVRRVADLRQLRRMVNNMASKLDDPMADPVEIRARLEAEAAVSQSGGDRAETIGELMGRIADGLLNGEPTDGVPTGLSAVDMSLGGLHPGQLIILAARPGVGKTSLATGIALDAADDGQNVLLVSLEMKGEDVARRIIAAESGQRFNRIVDGTADAAIVQETAARFADTPLSIWSGRHMTMSRIAGACRLHRARAGLDLAIVDYMGLVKPVDFRKPRHESMTEISGELKTLALSLGIPILALCQLNREADGGELKLSHLRDSGAIEQDADVVMLLDRKRGEANAMLKIVKARNGNCGDFELGFDGPAMRFSDRVLSPAFPRHHEFDDYDSSGGF